MSDLWRHNIAGSGTQTVSRDQPDLPFYYVHAEDRHNVCKSLVSWLNGGDSPKWAQSLAYDSEDLDSVSGDNHICISAAGPMILPPGDNGALNWQRDESLRAREHRRRMIAFLLGKVGRP